MLCEDGVSGMSRPTIFTITATWDDEVSVWSGSCDEIPAATDAPTLDGLLEKMTAIAIDLLPDNHPDVSADSLFLQIDSVGQGHPTLGLQ